MVASTPLPAILGPTATGKTELAIAVALRLDGEIVSVDSRQAYRGMTTGTAAPDDGQRERVRHHGVGFLDPNERYGAGRFARLARCWIEDIAARGRTPVLAGGTGFFFLTLVRPIFREPRMEPAVRRRLEDWLEARPLEDLRRWSRTLDPEFAARLPVLDRQRCLRALELALLTGQRLTWWQDHGPPEAAPVDSAAVVLTLAADEHRERIRDRAERLLDGGWPAEVDRLLVAGLSLDSQAFNSIGFRDVAAWISGRTSREDTLARIVRDTWAYARRQRTWFRHQMPPGTARLDARMPLEEAVDRVVGRVRAAGRQGTAAR